ncbi:MAG: chalcone isomerase family protein [Myxococcota bacterium]
MALAAVLACWLPSGPVRGRITEGVQMSERVQVAGRTLVLNGMGVRGVPPYDTPRYVAGLYLEEPSADAEAILCFDQPRHLILHFVDDVTADALTTEWTGALEAAASGRPRVGGGIDDFAAMIPDMEENDSMVLSYAPRRGTNVIVDGRGKGTLPGATFARALFSLWIGDRALDPKLRRALLGLG